jgi:hypothetical protein
MTSYRLFGVVSRLRYAKIKAPAFNLQGRVLLPSVDGQTENSMVISIFFQE